MGCIVNRLIESVLHNDANVRGDTYLMQSNQDLAGAPVLLRMVLVHALMVL